MKIAVLGAGAMGSIYGGRLSTNNEVCLIDKNAALIEKIARDGLIIHENGIESLYRPEARTESSGMGPVDLVILFVKALYSEDALRENKAIIGSETAVLTLQNGAGHEDLISAHVSPDRIVIGTTEDNGAVLELGVVRRGGTGRTNIGMASGTNEALLERLKTCFDEAGFDTRIYDNIRQLIWDKLFTNVSLSALTGVLQVPIGFIASDAAAWELTQALIKEAVGVAQALGLQFDEAAVIDKVRQTSLASPEGKTSICADLEAGRLTEVHTISGAVVRAGEKTGADVRLHRFMVGLIRALEHKGAAAHTT